MEGGLETGDGESAHKGGALLFWQNVAWVDSTRHVH